MKEIKGLIFDCDGTLADTMPMHWRAWQVIAEKYKLHFPEDRFYSLGGVPSPDILKMLAQEQVLGRVAGEGKLREQHEVGARVARGLRALEDAFSVAGDVANRGVQLAEGEAHLSWLIWLRP